MAFLFRKMKLMSSQTPTSSSSLPLVNIDEAENDAGHDDTDNGEIVSELVINSANDDATYQWYSLTKLNIAPCTSKVPDKFFIKIFFFVSKISVDRIELKMGCRYDNLFICQDTIYTVHPELKR